ncbi:hypothetical protein E2C01_027648 [Portunus trituberculatus]|uniref:Uncharacterized protein n=1 Tax=Portunus trituberculatus TaxID=210409 RepID=A0A5B7EPE7_PORTR|nr:hypothetical protein [Portunus trituberculatus]
MQSGYWVQGNAKLIQKKMSSEGETPYVVQSKMDRWIDERMMEHVQYMASCGMPELLRCSKVVQEMSSNYHGVMEQKV